MSEVRKAVRFDRVSSADQRDGFSLDAQKSMGEKYAKEHSLRVVKNWAVDESASKEDDRKSFFELIAYVKQHQVKDIIFDKVDRACRGFKSAVLIEELVDKFGVRFHFTREHLIIDKDSPPSEKMRFYLGAILAKYYIDNLRVEIKKGQSARREAGFWNSKAPFGYKNVRVGKDERAIIVLDDDLAPLVREVFELYSTGNYPYSALVDHLSSKASHRKISKRVIEEMIVNPFYYGHMKVKGELMKGVHAPIIDKGLWDACQKIKGIRSARHQLTRKGVIEKPLMGFITCGICGHAVTGESKKKASGKIYIYYHCANAGCSERKTSTPQATLMGQIGSAFEPFARFTPKATRAFIDNLSSGMHDFELFTQKMTGELAQKRMEIKENILRLEKHRNDGLISDADFHELSGIKQTALEDLTIEIDAHNETDLKTFKEGLRIIELFISVRNFMKIPGNDLEKIRLAKCVLSNPKLTNGTLEYSYEKPFDVLLEFAGLPVVLTGT